MARKPILEFLNGVTRYGRLSFVREVEPLRRPQGWAIRVGRFLCDCGAESDLRIDNVKRGLTTSCGCYDRETKRLVSSTHGESYGDRATVEYRAWASMISRCHEKNHHCYANYGARGVKVCSEWRDDYLAFLSHVGRKPSPLHSLDRIDNDKGYEPGNVRWATQSRQNRNQRRTHWIEYEGETVPLPDLAERFGLSHTALRARLRYGWSIGDALKIPVLRKGIKRKGLAPRIK